jgi:hypothetical protein
MKLFRALIPSPSFGVSTGGVMQVVDRAKDFFHSGRPAGNFGPPVCLFNHALGLFEYHLRQLDNDSFPINVSPALIRLAQMFMACAANSYRGESSRTEAIKATLNDIINVPLNWEASQSLFGIRPDAINFGDIPFFVMEVKNEAGLEGDASLQAALSYARIATSFLHSVRSFYIHCSCHPFY